MAGGVGARLFTQPRDIPGHAFWFGEDQARYVLAVPESAAFIRAAEAAGVAGGAHRNIRRAGFDTAGWRHNIGPSVARGARTLLPVLDGRPA